MTNFPPSHATDPRGDLPMQPSATTEALAAFRVRDALQRIATLHLTLKREIAALDLEAIPPERTGGFTAMCQQNAEHWQNLTQRMAPIRARLANAEAAPRGDKAVVDMGAFCARNGSRGNYPGDDFTSAAPQALSSPATPEPVIPSEAEGPHKQPAQPVAQTAPEPPFQLEPQLAPPAELPEPVDPDKALWHQLRGRTCVCGKTKAAWFFFCADCDHCLPAEILGLLAEIENATGEEPIPQHLTDDAPRRYRLALTFLRQPEPALRSQSV